MINARNLKYLQLFLLLLFVAGFIFLKNNSDGKLHVYFCDVGQGDAIYIRMPTGADMLIDGGPNSKVIDCLSKHMPFYDRKIDLVVLTHPQADHLKGLIDVIERYNVTYFASSSVGNQTEGYSKLVSLIKERKIQVKNLFSGSSIDFGNVKYKVVWPEKEWLFTHLNCSIDTSCSSIANRNSSVLGAQTSDSDLNDFSVVGLLSFNNFDLLLPGDGDQRIQGEILKENLISEQDNILEVLKVPHHGSKTGVSTEFIEKIKPVEAIISVGKNSYGHPSSITLDLLNKKGIKILRTDEKGDIEVYSDGLSWNTRVK